MEINQFFVAGINYRKTDASVRGDFAVNADQYNSLLQKAAQQGLSEILF
jgi:glutamyl-tRNA reductase